jgi:hypothetical protein
MTARHTRWFLVAPLILLSGCAGYRFGAQSLYPVDVQTVYVPMFKSSSFRQDLGEQLTEAVVKEIEKRTPYKVVANADADSVLTGIITSETRHLMVETNNGDSRELEGNLTVKVSWTSRRGDALHKPQDIPIPAEAVDVKASSHFVPEYGQSTATAQLQAIQRLAEQIVSLMEAPW